MLSFGRMGFGDVARQRKLSLTSVTLPWATTIAVGYYHSGSTATTDDVKKKKKPCVVCDDITQMKIFVLYHGNSPPPSEDVSINSVLRTLLQTQSHQGSLRSLLKCSLWFIYSLDFNSRKMNHMNAHQPLNLHSLFCT